MNKKNKNFGSFKIQILDKEEQELEDAINRGEYDTPLRGAELEKIETQLQEAAQNTMAELRKDKTISLRVSSKVIERSKEKAARLGIPYQTLIGSWIHQAAMSDEIKM